jgi:anaerobic selenocysteine-containing dehydrogenase
MRRVGPKGSGELARISWDEALATIAARLGDVIAVGNARGAFFAIADVTDRVRPGVATTTASRSTARSDRAAGPRRPAVQGVRFS